MRSILPVGHVVWGRRVLGLILCLAPLLAQGEPRTLEYVMLSNGTPIGEETDRYAGAGAIDSHYAFNDRGRGPDITAHYEFDDAGLPASLRVAGVDYLKAAVDETLQPRDGGRAWRSAADAGASPADAFYLSQDGVAGVELAALARVAATHDGAAVPLLPSGSARVSVVAELRLADGDKAVAVHAVSITGLGFAPSILWLDERGDFFASISSYTATVRRGWEAALGSLQRRQTELERAHGRALAQELATRLPTPLVFEHVAVFDAEHARRLDDQTVVVRGERVVAVGPSGSVVVPRQARHIDGRGQTLLPGLFDMHMHVGPDDAILCIAAGVTSGRDMGNDIDGLEALRRDWERNALIGPHLWRAGVIDGPGRYQAPAGFFVQTAGEAQTAVRRYAALGYVQVKTYSSLAPALVAPIARTAHSLGLRVSGHVPEGMIAEDFVRAGADEIQHVNFLFLDLLRAVPADTRTPDRFTVPALHAASVDLDSAASRTLIALLVRHHTVVDPTLVAFEDMLVARPGTIGPAYAAVADRLPLQVRREALHGGLAVTPDTDPVHRAAFDAFLALTGRLYAAGVPLLVGTDSVPGFMLHRELELEVRAGIPPAKALQNATWLAARVLHADRRLGSIRPGKRADLLLVEGDPTTRIGDIRRGRLVLKDGILFDPARLYAAIGTAPPP